MEIKTTIEIYKTEDVFNSVKWVRVDDEYIDALTKLQDGLRLIEDACKKLSKYDVL
jgi:hypothetical protein